MDGILIIDKPAGLTSHDVVARLRRILKTKRIGHTGTLDPFATGVLVMLVGKATRLAQFLDKDEKAYKAVVRFGYETDTGDRTGAVGRESGVGSRESEVGPGFPSIEDVQAVLPQFRGEIEQVPPMYSAKKVAGKKLYELARKGIEVERKPVELSILELEIFQVKPPAAAGRTDIGADLGLGTWDLGLKVTCSAGTYIRTLAEDIARAAGSAAHLAELRRTRAGKFAIEQAVTLEDLEKLDDPYSILVPMNDAVSHLAEVKLTGEEIAKIRNGVKIPARTDSRGVHTVRLTGAGDELIAIALQGEEEGVIRPRLVF